MRTTTFVAQLSLRLLGVILIVLGLVFWTGRALTLLNVHMLVGVLFVLALWTLSGVAVAARRSTGLAAFAVLWGLVVLAFGMVQKALVPGSQHWVIQVLHLVIGLAAMWMGESLAARIKAANLSSQA